VKQVLVLGATGRTGSQVVARLLSCEDVHQTLFVRSPEKVTVKSELVTVVCGDMNDAEGVKNVMKGQDIIISCLEGYLEMQGFAENIIAGLPTSSVRRIIWLTGMGIHGEVPGINGLMLRMMAKKYPAYVKGADLIMESGVDYTLLRASQLTMTENMSVTLTHEGERINGKAVSRKAVANVMAKMAIDEDFGRNESLGITG